ncbi:dTDP-4-dehydrorhamnose reductase [Endozoicomonas euniceicola]|uniref:dTDP-4-dehydrorhamnose reductase n=1 Tax=Endozoicomonas euniceicola TaxID=1234143 RepID=A0ABY6GUG9_9GAMM|nr:dTDP-4-dehydrorhamnose reductase [Endozoicomonas euniceicola]UYM16422.1 dTDP-4-dehydrorhamnose reductase [Endozoicomonas euniceicola]
MRILITGSAGMLGYSLSENFRDGDCYCCTRAELDITNESQVFEIVLKFNPDIIINGAAYTSAEKAEDNIEEAYAVNCYGVKYLAAAAESVNSCLIHISTDYVFKGDKKNGCYIESDIAEPVNIYGKSKLAGEQIVKELCSKYIIIRTSWLFNAQNNNFVTSIINSLRNKKELTVVNDQLGGPTFLGDLVDSIDKIVNRIKINDVDGIWGLYHYSGFPYVSWYEFACVIAQYSQLSGIVEPDVRMNSILSENYILRAKRPKNSQLNSMKFCRVFGVEQKDWRVGLEKVIYSISNNL